MEIHLGTYKTRMHSSRMRTVRSSSHLRGYTWSGGCTWSQGGDLVPRGVPSTRGMYLVPGVYLVLGGVPGLEGGTWSGGCTCPGTPPCGQTHTCKNITFATSLRTVTSKYLVINGTVFIGSELDSHPFYD